jgi:uncharacterized protein YndB with AHSA1/START domain
MMVRSAHLDLSTPSEREITLTRIFDAPRSLVFETMTRPKMLKRWLYGPDGWSLDVCEIDRQVGGSFRFVWQRHADGTEVGMRGVIRELVPAERIVQTERFEEGCTGPETVGTLVLSEQDGKTTLTNTLRYASREARDAMLQADMPCGLAEGYDRLEILLDAMQGR